MWNLKMFKKTKKVSQGICLPSGNFFPLAFIWATAAGGMKPWTTETFWIEIFVFVNNVMIK